MELWKVGQLVKDWSMVNNKLRRQETGWSVGFEAWSMVKN